MWPRDIATLKFTSATLALRTESFIIPVFHDHVGEFMPLVGNVYEVEKGVARDES